MLPFKTLPPPKPIVIVGSKGAGKTTFINHLLISDEYNSKSHLTVYLDLESFFNTGNQLKPDNLAKQLLNLVNEKYESLELHSLKVLKRIYHKEIKENDEGIWHYYKSSDEAEYQKKISDFFVTAKSQSLDHLTALNTYLIRERRKRIIAIIDNADQFSDDVQKDIFLFAHTLSKKSLCGSIISLREGYYYKWRNSPPFDINRSNVYHISAPKYTDVLQKRINFALKTFPSEGETKGYNNDGKQIVLPNAAVVEYLTTLRDSLFSESNSDLIDYLNYTTYPNIREGLNVFKQFLISGHVNSYEYLIRQVHKGRKERTKVIPIFEFIKAIGLNNKLYYNSEISLISNIFIPPADSNDHFLKLYILKDLLTRLEIEGVSNKYCTFSDIIKRFVSYGYKFNTVFDVVTSLIKQNFIDTDEHINDTDIKDILDTYNIAISSKGYYYFKSICFRFHYLDLVLQDTPIYDKDSFYTMKNSFPLSGNDGKRNLNLRLQSVKHFLDYLKECDKNQSNQLKTIFGSMSDYLTDNVQQDIKNIEKVLQINNITVNIEDIKAAD